jgi:pre-rRNA-processing protein TSR4
VLFAVVAMGSALPCFYVYSDSEVLIGDRNANVNGKVQELAELKPLPAVEEPTAAVEGVKELWEGEEYEPDHSLSADRTYLKFKKKLDLNPEQCYRWALLSNLHSSKHHYKHEESEKNMMKRGLCRILC